MCGFLMRLDTPAAVESFDSLYGFVNAACEYAGAYHLAPMSTMCAVCVCSVVTVFAGSVLDFEIDV